MSELLLEARGISKSFGTTQALKNVSFKLNKGEIRGLYGKNGAGKSVFSKILAGVLQPDKGSIYLEGEKVKFDNPKDAKKAGIFLDFQEQSLIPDLSVAENIFLGTEPKEVGKNFLDRKKMERLALESLKENFSVSINPSVPVKKLDPTDFKIVEIARTIRGKPKLVIFDESIEKLSSEEKKKLIDLMTRLKEKGVGIIFITHRIGESLQSCDSVTVFRDGEKVSTKRMEETRVSDILKMMSGKKGGFSYPPKSSPDDEVVLSVKNFRSKKGNLKNISFDLKRGELLGVAGKKGSGARNLGRCIYGDISVDGGQISIAGENIPINSIKYSLRNKVAFFSGDREKQVFESRPTSENIVSQNIALGQMSDYGVLNQEKIKSLSGEMSEKYRVEGISSLNVEASALSGGNKQKMLVARIFSLAPSVILMENALEGVDLASKEQILKMLMRNIRQGKSGIFYSSDVQEIIGVCNRVMILRNGRITDILPAEEEYREKVIEKTFL